MFRTFPKVWSQVLCPVDTDKVLFAQPIPAGSILNNVFLNISILAEAAVLRTSAAMYGIHAYVIPIIDPDAGTTPDNLWDQMVPKDKVLSADMVDMDTALVDSDAIAEPGLINVEGMLNVGVHPQLIFSREKFITWADQKGGYDRTADNWMPSDKIVTKMKRSVFVEFPSYFLLALSSPLTTFTQTAWKIMNTDAEWTQLQYMEYTLEDAWKNIVGLIESGAETPYAEAMVVIGEYLEVLHEETAAAWAPQTWRAFGKASFDITVPGSLDQISLSGAPD